MNVDLIQKAQEDEYDFPYHHIAQFKEGFTECMYDTWGINYVSTIEYILKILETQEFTSLLDVGCGDGRLTKEIALRFPDRHIAGVDYSKKALAFAKAMHPHGKFYHVNILHKKLHSKFDLATLIEVLEHIDPRSQDKFIKALSALLTENGTLLLTVPHENIPLGYKHFRHFTIQSLSDCLKPYFQIVDSVFLEKRSVKKNIIDTILVNRFFVLNHKRVRNSIYRYFKSTLFFADSEKHCGRIFIKAIKKE